MRRLLSGIAFGALGLAASMIVAPAPSSAAAASCYGGAVGWKTGAFGLSSQATFGPYYASSRCVDVNLRVTSAPEADVYSACVRFGSATASCNYQTIVAGGSWRVIATNVKDGTKLYVSIFNGNGGSPVTGQVAY
ncbi:hypothetical protein AB0B94_02215 [Micromonospora sp. NPDC048986]|uniref:hypothetical protein n=1 Tax=Micromonospora sp. NPDC048986 TaxID=3155644 RepID=UPI0033E8318C